MRPLDVTASRFFCTSLMRTRSHSIMTPKRRNAGGVAVIGSGPYGLSVAAHLKQAGMSTHVFGEPMSFWRQHMPKGMLLRSPWCATHISNPDSSLSLDIYAHAHGIDRNRKLPREKFVAYGEWFQKHAVPDVDHRAVRLVEATSNGFQLTLADGEIFVAEHVVIATGLVGQEYRPPLFRDLSAAFVTHTSEHADFSALRGKAVAVIGRGQSACESAALLAEAGAYPEMFAYGEIRWLGDTTNTTAKRTAARWLRRALTPPSEVGPVPLSWLAEWPGLVRQLPATLRDDFTQRCLKPAAAGWLKPRLANVTYTAADKIIGARALSDRIVLDFDDGARTYNHVLLGTGYRIDIARLGILSRPLLEKILCAEGSPLLGSGFESSVPKLHFVGSYAVKSFGPLLRFIAGARFAARSVTKAIRVSAMMPDVTAAIPDPITPNLLPSR
jgi:cation diffusion facilitator CzcD-associated flavoprotein CzcO